MKGILEMREVGKIPRKQELPQQEDKRRQDILEAVLEERKKIMIADSEEDFEHREILLEVAMRKRQDIDYLLFLKMKREGIFKMLQ